MPGPETDIVVGKIAADRRIDTRTRICKVTGAEPVTRRLGYGIQGSPGSISCRTAANDRVIAIME